VDIEFFVMGLPWRYEAMKIKYGLALAAALTLSFVGCTKKQGQEPKKSEEKIAAGTLPEDTAFASGNVQAAVMEVQTKVDVPGMGPAEGGDVDEELRRAQEASLTSQTWIVSEERGKLIFNNEDFIVPKGTELRFNPASKRYVLVDPQKGQYWAMSGGEIGNLLEGGPITQRDNYTISVNDTKETETIAGVQAKRSDAELGFDWIVKTKSGPKKGRVKVKLTIWHSADAKLKASWGKMMVDFLTVPFQDEKGQRVVDELKRRITFPVKWIMEVANEGQKREKGEPNPKLVTTAQSLEIKELKKADVASPPKGVAPAAGPYEFGEGGQTAKEELLAKIPPKQETPPQPPPEEK
jgi:hypothetical protein